MARSKQSFELSKGDTKEEIIRCGKDPVYFLANYVKISRPGTNAPFLFNLYDFQRDVIRKFASARYSCILKSRQMGITTLICGYCCWLMLFHRNKEIIVLATKLNVAANLVRKIKKMYNTTPQWLRLSKIITDNKNSLELSNGSFVKASSTTSDAGRSESLSLLIIDEAGHIDNMSEIWESIYSTTQIGGNIIVSSTPKGAGGWYHQLYRDAVAGLNNFEPIKLMWNLHPEYDQKWFEKTTKNMSKRGIAQELLCDFLMSGDTFIDFSDLEWVTSNILQPKWKAGPDRNFWIWENCKPGGNYLISVDVSRGDSSDYSAFHIIDLDNMKQVAEYKGKLDIDLFSCFLNEVGKEYNSCMLVVENNNVGFAVVSKLIEMEYPNLYFSKKSTNEYVENPDYETGVVPGFTTSVKTRPLILAKLEEFVRNRALTTYSQRLEDELKSFIWRSGKPEAQKGCNDDLVMALAIACWVRDTAIIQNQRDICYKEALLNSIVYANTNFNTKMPGMSGYNPSFDFMKDFNKKNPLQDFLWVIKG